MMVDRILEGLDQREPAALARAISLVENQRDGFERVLSHAHARLGRGGTRRIGITGPPGAGKSTLTEGLIRRFREHALSVGVVAVDPTSPFTGGALLGDRIRMESVSLDPQVFIRSMATRGAHGGLATTTEEVADLLEAFKAGVMEIADIYLINKSDRPGADKLRQEVEVMLGIRRGNAFAHITPHHRAVKGGQGRSRAVEDSEWEPPVLGTVASKGEGIAELEAALERHYQYLQTSGKLTGRRRERLAARTRAVLERGVRRWLAEATNAEELLASRLDDVADGRRSPYDVAAEILDQVKSGAGEGGRTR